MATVLGRLEEAGDGDPEVTRVNAVDTAQREEPSANSRTRLDCYKCAYFIVRVGGALRRTQ